MNISSSISAVESSSSNSHSDKLCSPIVFESDVISEDDVVSDSLEDDAIVDHLEDDDLEDSLKG